MSSPNKKPKNAKKPAQSSSAKKAKKPAESSSAKGTAITYDLDSLAKVTGPVDPDLDAATFQKVREDSLAVEGARINSQKILDDLPRFIGSGVEIRAGLSAEQVKKLHLPEGYFALAVAYGLKLRALKVEHDKRSADASAGKADREASARRETTDGIAERDNVYDALRNALGDDVIVKLDAIVGTAETAEKLAAGLEALAGFIEGVLKNSTKTEKLLLEQYSVGAASATALRAKAARVRQAGTVTATPGRRVTQRALDIFDGKVLSLIEKGMRAFRAARRADPSILLPELNKIAWMFETRGSKPKPPKSKPDTKAPEDQGNSPDDADTTG